MQEYSYPLSLFAEKMRLPIDYFDSEKAVIDVSLINDISHNWDYKQGVAIAVGYLYKEKMNILLADSQTDEEFKKYVVQDLTLLLGKTEFNSFNNQFEMGVIQGTFGLKLDINEIKPFKVKGWRKDKFFDELLRKRKIQQMLITDPFMGNDMATALSYERYLMSGNNDYLMDIVRHKINNLLKESLILKADWSDYKVDNQGWLVAERVNS